MFLFSESLLIIGPEMVENLQNTKSVGHHYRNSSCKLSKATLFLLFDEAHPLWRKVFIDNIASVAIISSQTFVIINLHKITIIKKMTEMLQLGGTDHVLHNPVKGTF